MSVRSLRRLLTMGVCCAALAIPSSARAQYPLEMLHEFGGFSSSKGPEARLIQGRDGYLYGTTAGGGAFNLGTIFKMNSGGAITTLHSFGDGVGGDDLATALLEATDGYFYGMTRLTTPLTPSSGHLDTVVYKMSPAGAFSVLHVFPYFQPVAPLIQGFDGNLYGVTSREIFRMTLSGEVTVLHDFDRPEGGLDPAAIIQGSDGNFYGTTRRGGSANCTSAPCGGTVFRMSPQGIVSVLHTFTGGSDGSTPGPDLIRGADGNLYGIANAGAGFATVFRLSPAGAVASLYRFPAWAGYQESPYGRSPSLVSGSDGNLYGSSAPGGTFEPGGGLDTIFRIPLQGVGNATVMHTFGPGSDAFRPIGLVQASDGRFYGTAAVGGIGRGTVFVMDPTGATATLHSFLFGSDGLYPTGLIQASDGNFYGVTEFGGIYHLGTIFRLTPAGAYTVVYAFTGGRDGGIPVNVVQGRDGRLYGVATGNESGVIFAMTLDGHYTVLHAFNGPQEGAVPQALTLGADGNLYGSTMFDGPFDRGTLFRSTQQGALTVLHAFTGGSDGSFPQPRLIPGGDGSLYGTAARNGTATTDPQVFAFRITPSGTFTVLRDLSALGRNPTLLTMGSDGNVYGAPDCGGNFFRMSPSGENLTLLAETGTSCFSGIWLGPVTLTVGADGSLYGTASGGGSGGQIFRMNPTGAVTVLHSFGGDLDDPRPLGVIQAADGSLYGATLYGGRRSGFLELLGAGTLFRLNHLVPLSPTSVIATPAAGGITLRWRAGLAATSYTIKKLVAGQAPIVVARGLTITSFTVPIDTSGADVAYIVTAVNAAGESVASPPMHLPWGSTMSRTPTITTVRDYDGDGSADLTVFRSSSAEWFTLTSSGRVVSISWGAPALLDRPVPADYDGDGKSDVAVYRETTGEWFISRSSDGALSQTTWGFPAAGDLPVPADYDGDGVADLAVFRGTTGEWFIHRSSDDTVIQLAWGSPALGDLPVPADYDGDGRTDIAVYRGTTGEWFVHQSSDGALVQFAWGSPAFGDVPVPADYDGDGRTDVAVYRGTTGEWFIAYAAGGSAHHSWGTPALADLPIPADYDGDGRADPAVYRFSTGEWLIVRNGQLRHVEWGAPFLGDAVRKY